MTRLAKAMGAAALGRLATEGFPIPERFKAALSRFDLNGNGKLTKQEIDAMPENLRERDSSCDPRTSGREPRHALSAQSRITDDTHKHR